MTIHVKHGRGTVCLLPSADCLIIVAVPAVPLRDAIPVGLWLRSGPGALLLRQERRHDGGMAKRALRLLGWLVLAGALAALVAYMASVGWTQASLVAGVAGFFVAVAGLILAIAPRKPASLHERRQAIQQMRNVSAASAHQDAQVLPGENITQSMESITVRDARQRIRPSPRPIDDPAAPEGDGDE